MFDKCESADAGAGKQLSRARSDSAEADYGDLLEEQGFGVKAGSHVVRLLTGVRGLHRTEFTSVATHGVQGKGGIVSLSLVANDEDANSALLDAVASLARAACGQQLFEFVEVADGLRKLAYIDDGYAPRALPLLALWRLSSFDLQGAAFVLLAGETVAADQAVEVGVENKPDSTGCCNTGLLEGS